MTIAEKKQAAYNLGRAVGGRIGKVVPYETRLRYYAQEKAELVSQSADLSQEEFDARLQSLIRKWGI